MMRRNIWTLSIFLQVRDTLVMFVERFPSHVMLLPVTCPVIIEEINKLILDTYMNFYCDVILKSKSF